MKKFNNMKRKQTIVRSMLKQNRQIAISIMLNLLLNLRFANSCPRPSPVSQRRVLLVVSSPQCDCFMPATGGNEFIIYVVIIFPASVWPHASCQKPASCWLLLAFFATVPHFATIFAARFFFLSSPLVRYRTSGFATNVVSSGKWASQSGDGDTTLGCRSVRLRLSISAGIDVEHTATIPHTMVVVLLPLLWLEPAREIAFNI